MLDFRSTTVTNTSTTIKTTGADVGMVNIVNRHSAAIFVKFYNSPVATFQDTPIITAEVLANAAITVALPALSAYIFSSTNGLSVRAVTGATDSDNTAPATTPIIEIRYN